MQRVALVHDWLFWMRGGENCLHEILKINPKSDVYSLFYRTGKLENNIEEAFRGASFLNALPYINSYYRFLLPVYKFGISDLSKKISNHRYDKVVSISHCVAKNIHLSYPVTHISYCLTPMRYIWDQYENYFLNKPYEPIVGYFRERLIKDDLEGAKNVSEFFAISNFVASRIKDYYGRESKVIYPPVDRDWLTPNYSMKNRSGYVAVSALVPYKNNELIIRAFNELGLPLTIVGKGPEYLKLRSIAKSNIKFLSNLTKQELSQIYSQAKALVFAAEEDFGIVPVEAQASGTPVICLNKGGARETVTTLSGMFFDEPVLELLSDAILKFEDSYGDFNPEDCIKNSLNFDKSIFYSRFKSEILDIEC